MDQRTLVVSCVEYYSDLKNIPSNKVFISFQQSGFIDLILDSHKTFPEMDIDFFVGMIDESRRRNIPITKTVPLSAQRWLHCCRKSTK